jgi:hypothetical protein
MRVDDVAWTIWQALGVGSTQLNVIGATATYEISYRLGRAVQVDPMKSGGTRLDLCS